MRSRRSFLGLCLAAAVSQWLGTISLFLGVPKATRFHFFFFIVFRGSKSNVSRFLRLYSCNGLDAKPAGALLFRMRSRRSFLVLCLVAAVSQWLGHDFIVFRGSKSNTFSLFFIFIVFRGSKSNVSRFLRLYSCNGLDAKPAGALLFRMRSRRSFLDLCLVAAVSQWLGHDFIVFRGSKSKTFSLFFIVFRGSKKQRFEIFEAVLLQWLGRKTCWGSAFSDALPTQLSWALPGGCSFAVAAARFHCF